ncbi:MAG TPA: FecR family protein, partial [Bryobacteraceae bacterium]|nr:FecR family protein [Bryobacteraceae bacterium]
MRRILILLLPAALFAAEARYARLGQFEGQAEVQLTAASDWMAAERNLPLPESAWLRTGESSRVEIELDEGSAWRLGPGSQAEVSDYSRLSTGQRVTLLTLDRGLAYFTGQPEGKDALTLAVPGAQITVSQRARLRLEVQESWSRISVLEGVVRFSSPAAEIDLREGQTTRVEPANPARFFLNREIASLDLDRWSEVRDKTLASTPSAAHVIERYGLADLDTAGKWIQTADLGAVWKPEVADGWLPFQNGRWRWYDAVGYTWISADPWGWLPYHYGRWAHREDLGWVWAPAKNAIFKPGEVYWLRGTRLVGWGPLAPGETWKGPGSDAPRQFLNVYTTFAAFWQDAAVIDPAGFTARPDEPLVVASFALALPSPAFVAARLDATRPLLVTRTRVAPVVEEAAFQSSPGPTIMVVNPPPPPPVVVITEPPPEPQQPAAPVAYPVPVYTGMVVMNPPQPATAPAPQTAVAKATAPP